MAEVNPKDDMIQTVRLLVVSRDSAILRPLWSVAESQCWRIDPVATAWDAIERLQAGASPRLLLLDVPRGGADNLHILRWLRRLCPELPVVVVCFPEDAMREEDAIRFGAEDVLIRPFSDSHLQAVISRHLASPSTSHAEMASEDIEQLGPESFFVSASPVTQKLRAQAQLLAEADVPVLILGEMGSGKDTVARLIHKLSVRSGFQFLKVNCADMPAELLDVELFGCANDSSYSLGRTGPGKLERANGGTVFLSEITRMPMSLQAKLMDALQDKVIFRGGSDKPTAVDVRILASTSASLDGALAEGKLMADLYYRLSAFTVQVPPLRQRKSEIPLLLPHLMHQMSRHYGLPPREFSAAALDACQRHSWPGNLVELNSFVKRYLVAGEREFASGDLSLTGKSAKSQFTYAPGFSTGYTDEKELDEEQSGPKSLKSLIQSVKCETERHAIGTALQKTGWNRKAAARLLQVSYRTLLYKIDQYHLSASDSMPAPQLVHARAVRSNGKW